MKKLNRKGFTLVELLAVIIILAIVVGITIPAITNIINDSKNNALGVAVDAAEDYLADQYSYMNIDYNTASKNFKDVFTGPTPTDKVVTLLFEGTANATDLIYVAPELLKEMGLAKDNVKTVTVTISSAGVACVKVTEIPTTSEYYSTQYWTTAGLPSTTKAPNYTSKSCS